MYTVLQSLCYWYMWCGISFLIHEGATCIWVHVYSNRSGVVISGCLLHYRRLSIHSFLWRCDYSYCCGITFCQITVDFLFFPLLSPLCSSCRIPDPGRFGRGERASGNECDGRVWQGRCEGHNSASAAGGAVKARPDAIVPLWKIGDSVVCSYWLWVFFWEKLRTIIFLL